MTLHCPAAWRRGAIVAVLAALTSSVGVAGVPTFRGRAWLNHYYENPDPEQFVASLFDLSRNHYFALPGHAMVGVGFVASVFRQNPERVDEWLLYCRPLPERERRLIISALWYAGYPKGEAYLQLYAEGSERPRTREILERVLASTPSFDRLAIESQSALYLSWGKFLATGDQALLERIFAAIPTVPRLTLRDRWWFACTLAERPDVIEWCRAELPSQPVEVQETMELVLSAAQAVALAD